MLHQPTHKKKDTGDTKIYNEMATTWNSAATKWAP